jgi:hypothetical protein
MWAVHGAKGETHGTMRLMNPLAGEPALRFETFAVPGGEEQSREVRGA